MNKENKKLISITSVLCLLPMSFSLLVYERLPEQIAVHWNSAGEADSYVHKAFAAFGLPLFFLAVNIFSKWRLFNEPRREAQSFGMRNIIIWLIPTLSVVVLPMTLSIALGATLPIVTISLLLVGILLIAIGNYLPKSRHNYTIGIKLPWTLNSEKNWNSTHRFAGYIYIAGGAAIILINFLLSKQPSALSLTIFFIIAAIAAAPTLYSYMLYRREN